MVHALIFAGGTGTRMKSADIPKQFIEVDGKPIIIRTLEHFSKHMEVDSIVIVCVESWIGYLENLIKHYSIKKVAYIVAGGNTGYESIHNGLLKIAEHAANDDIVLICDGVRPVLTQTLISICIKDAEQYGTAVPVVPSIDSVLISNDGNSCSKNISRREVYITQAPQGYKIEKIMLAHQQADKMGKTNIVSSADLMIELGYDIHIFIGERANLKVTTPEDLETLRSHYYYGHYKTFAREELRYEL